MSQTEVLSSIVEPALIRIDGTPIADSAMANLLDVRVELVLNGVGQATLRFFDEDFKLVDDPAFDFGKSIEVSFTRTGRAPVMVFKGEIVALAVEQGPTDLHELVVTCLDKGHRMARSTTARTYQNVTYSDVVSQIAGRYGLTPKVAAGIGRIKFPYLLQTTDDAAFLSEIVRRSGGQWRISGTTLEVLGKAETTAPVDVEWGTDLLRFRSRLNAAVTTDELTTLGWDPLTKRAITGTSRHKQDLLSNSDGTGAGRGRARTMGTAKRVGTRQVFTSADEAMAVADALRAEVDSTNLNARGETYGNPALKPGTMVNVKGVGNRLRGKYFLTAVEHVYSRTGYVTRFTAGPLTPSTVGDLLSSGEPPATHLAPVIGIVTNNNDTTDGRQGVVRVKFPTFGDNVESAWARVIGIGAGPNRGMLVMPAVNDEVLVVFEGGDYRRPVVLGGLWNGRDKPKVASSVSTQSGNVLQWALTTGKGQELLFDDSKESAVNITLAIANTLTKLYVGKDKVELISDGRTLEVKSRNASVLLNGQNGDITLKGTNINIQATASVKITANANVEINGTAQAKVNGSMVEVKGSAMTNVGNGGSPTMVAGMPVKIN